MSEISEETIRKCYKPYDVVTNKDNDVGYIQEVNLNDCQDGFDNQVSYSVNWLVGHSYNAWWKHNDLTKHGNIFEEIARNSCHPFGGGKRSIDKIKSVYY